MSYNILVVCTGNICRSPMGEIVLREKLADAGITDVTVTSAGISAEEAGRGVDPRARQVLAEAGYPTEASQAAHRVRDE